MSNLSFWCFGTAHGFHSERKWKKIRDREFYKDITMERNNRKKYIHIERETDSNEIFAMPDKVESEIENDIENSNTILTRNT